MRRFQVATVVAVLLAPASPLFGQTSLAGTDSIPVESRSTAIGPSRVAPLPEALMAIRESRSVVLVKASVPQARRRQSSMMTYVAVGAFIGAVVGTWYAIDDSFPCDESCMFGIKPLILIPLGISGGTVVGGVTGGVAWKITHPAAGGG